MMYYQKYEARGNPMPFSIFFGGCPSGAMVGSMQFPAGISEADIAGGLRRAPLQLVKCETNDMLVPATAEVVIEGHVRPHERWDEGPFGEATGYRASPRMPRPVFRVDCITFRDDPIIPISCPGVDLDECEILFGVFSLTNGMEQELRSAGLPVREVMSPPGLKFALLVVTVEKGHAGITDRVVSAVRASKGGVFFQYIAVIDEDVDVTSLPEALHAVFTKTHPLRGIQVMPLAPGHPLVPFLDLHDKMNSRGAGLSFNATTPVEWDPLAEASSRVSFADSYPPELRQRVLGRWGEFGIDA
jgi:4-hydroxy-3-polyprenylbenzoate decarboxylase